MGGGRRARRHQEARRRFRRRLLTAAAVAVLLALLGVLLAMRGKQQEEVRRRQDGPETFVAISDSVQLEIRDVATGAVRRELVDVGPKDDPQANLIDATLSDDGRYVYFVQADLAAKLKIMRVSTDAGQPELITEGVTPAVSPDGKKLAYALEDFTALVVRDLDSGTEQRWTRGSTVDIDNTNAIEFSLSWSPDSRYLTFGLLDPYDVFVLDTTERAETTDVARRLGPPGERGERQWTLPTYRPDGRIAVVEACCGDEDYLRVVDAATGEIVGTDRTFGNVVSKLDYAPAGNHAIWTTPLEAVLRGTGRRPEVEVAENLTSATW